MSTRRARMSVVMHAVAFCAAVAGAVSGQEASSQNEWSARPENVLTCKTFAYGSSTFDVSTHGNVIGMEGPGGYEHIAIGTFQEGYVLCDSAGGARYDLGDTEFGFSASSTCSCPTSTSCTVTRRTADNKMELKQVFTLIASERALKISMTVRNLTASPLFGVVLRRQVDFDVDSQFDNNHGASERDSYFAWNDAGDYGSEAHLVVLRHVSPGVAREAKVNFFENTCNPADLADAAPNLGVDRTGTLQYNFGTINAGASKSTVLQYERD